MRSTLRSNHANRGFTLIELLIVVAIIVILAAILFPVFARARENARRSSCQSNLKQIGLAIMQYAQDNDELLPMAYNYGGGGTTGASKTWTGQIEPYLGIKTQNVGAVRQPSLIFRCPSDAIAPSAAADRRRTYSMPKANKKANPSGASDQYANRYVGGPHFVPPGNTSAQGISKGRNLSEILAPATTLLLVENPDAGNNLGGEQQGFIADATDQESGLPSRLHFDGWNYLFVDGHVKWLLPEATIGEASGGTMDNPNGMWTIADGD